MGRPKTEPPLGRYNTKRDFSVTPEPSGTPSRRAGRTALSFVVQKHWASRLHYDFRLELDGVLLSWAVPKGPSYDPAVKQMAVHVEDHPVSYGSFEGRIPKGNYGAGTVILWDTGTWEPVGDARDGLDKGKLVFALHGQKLAGLWELVRISKPEAKQDQWLLFKKRDAWARPFEQYDVISALPDSVVEKPLGLIEDREPRTAGPILTRHGHADLSKAPEAFLPDTLEPQLATLAEAPPSKGKWLVEGKLDGYRLLARIGNGHARLFTRNGNDWTSKFAELGKALEALPLGTGAWLDGEIVVLNDAGVPDFNRLQNAVDSARGKDILFFLFDAPFLDGRDLRKLPLVERRAALKAVLDGGASERLRFSESFDVAPAQMLQAACSMGLEGIMLKRADAPYESRRTETWLKLKCQQRQEFVVVGFNDRAASSSEVGSLLLGYHDEAGTLRFAGSVGTGKGWTAATGRALHERLSALEVKTPAVDPGSVKPGRWSRRASGAERWVRPELVVDVAFTEWTPDGHVRHPALVGVREDKPAQEVVREQTKGLAQQSTARAAARASARAVPAAVKVTNPERVIDPANGSKKVELVRYYESVAEWMLPHLRDRPVSLVRAPQGIAGQHFFQKHAETKMPGLTELDPALWPGHAGLLAIDSAEALVSAAQMNVVEFHTWNSTTKTIDRPDRVIFDLDPGESVTWQQLQDAALITRGFLEELGLKSWLKTSGGKGLHVVVPLRPAWEYERVKDFSQRVVERIARVVPKRFVAKSGPANRIGRIFIDYLRNGHGQTTVAAFSARARPGLGVSMPVSWDDLGKLKSASQWSIATAREHLSFQQSDPWDGYWNASQLLAKAAAKLGK